MARNHFTMVLPSIYANDEDRISVDRQTNGSNKPKTREIGKRMDNKKYTVTDIDNLMVSGSNASQTDDEDTQMLEMHDEDEVQVVSNILSQERSSNSDFTDSCISREALDLQIPTMMPTKMKSIFVVDTNFLISHLSTLENLRRLASSFHHQIVIPSTTIRELDGLKNSSRIVQIDETSESMGLLARRANDWIYSHLANLDSGVMGQKLRQMINSNCIQDDAILDCCLYFKEKLDCFVILLSNDKNLCMKALTEGLLTVSFRKGMTAQLIASMTYDENVSLYGPGTALDEPMTGAQESPKTNFAEVSTKIYTELTTIVIEAVHNVLLNEYGEDIELIGFQPDTLHDLNAVTKCIDRLWVSVFSEYFKRSNIKKNDWKDFPTSLTTVPHNVTSLKNMVAFWEEILHALYIKRNQSDEHDMCSIVQQWGNLISQCD